MNNKQEEEKKYPHRNGAGGGEGIRRPRGYQLKIHNHVPCSEKKLMLWGANLQNATFKMSH